ncbi:PAS domain-containing protein [Shewanella zhangzhouensis]|uniref:PAS domain-containing protein n=1 Tax=Shewanella zhangzhouensis TaxID=2864213 RepID=UPI001C65F3D5|nr:PAS domain-containing protein [Shewanella zhangzhouensis]QYK06422.1 PAS domain-containing protein [Shewanella zhangzhouensis]
MQKVSLENLVSHVDPLGLIHQLFEQSFDAICMLAGDPEDLHFVYANTSACNLMGYEFRELMGMPAIRLVGERTNQQFVDRINQCIATARYCRGATTFYRKDGSTFQVVWTIHPVMAKEGHVSFFMVTMRDLSVMRSKLGQLENTTESFRSLLKVFSGLMEDQSEDERQRLKKTSQDATLQLIQNATLFCPELRKDEDIALFGEDDLFDFSDSDVGVLPKRHDIKHISARDFAGMHGISMNDIRDLAAILNDCKINIELLKLGTSNPQSFQNVVQDLSDLASHLFLMDEFIDISTVVGHLANKLMQRQGSAIDPMLLDILLSLVEDFSIWHTQIFVTQDAPDIHQLDASIIGSAKQLLAFLG